MRVAYTALCVGLLVASGALAGLAWPGRTAGAAGGRLREVHPREPVTIRVAPEVRLDALARARVVLARPGGERTWGTTVHDTREAPDLLECRFLPSAPRGTTPKFDCVLSDGEVVKVKYGANPEIQAEVAATTLLQSLGFGADRVQLVPRLRCFGCPRRPFATAQLAEHLPLGQRLLQGFSPARSVEFTWVAMERRFRAPAIEAPGADGWAWFELQQASAVHDAALRSERDALVLMAVFLAHWDNKASNQRLVCLDPWRSDEQAGDAAALCQTPFALVQDLGATFGPHKVQLSRWAATPIWTDARDCAVSLRALPFGGGTMVDARISEAGRQLLLQGLRQWSSAEVEQLFLDARFEYPAAWTAAFLDKVAQIAHAGPCGA